MVVAALYGRHEYFVIIRDKRVRESTRWGSSHELSLSLRPANAKKNKMEELTLTTPSILFSAISLIMLAYTNRFLAYASVIRSLRTEHDQNPTAMTRRQIDNLRKRLYMTRAMQVFGVTSLLLCVVCTFFIYIGWQATAIYVFGAALLLLVISLSISIREILISVRALEYRLDNMKVENDR